MTRLPFPIYKKFYILFLYNNLKDKMINFFFFYLFQNSAKLCFDMKIIKNQKFYILLLNQECKKKL